MKWIILEGIDGVGKTSNGIELCRFLNEEVAITATYAHVFDTEVGRNLRELFLKSPDLESHLETLLLLATRVRYFHDVVAPLMNQDITIITDRFFWSILSMQGLDSLDVRELVRTTEAFLFKNAFPDLTILLDAEPTLCKQRLQCESRTDRIQEKPITFHQRVRSEFQTIFNNSSNNAIVIDASRDFNTVQTKLRETVLTHLFK